MRRKASLSSLWELKGLITKNKSLSWTEFCLLLAPRSQPQHSTVHFAILHLGPSLHEPVQPGHSQTLGLYYGEMAFGTSSDLKLVCLPVTCVFTLHFKLPAGEGKDTHPFNARLCRISESAGLEPWVWLEELVGHILFNFSAQHGAGMFYEQ